MKKTLASALTAALLSTTSAGAQVTTTTTGGASSAFGVDPIMRITSVFRTTVAVADPQTATVAVADPQTMPDARAQDAARRVLYQMGEGECATLTEIFHAECRLSSLNIAAPLPFVPSAQNPAQYNTVMTATAIYELRLRRQAPGQ